MSDLDPKFASKRKHIRFTPDPLDYALIEIETGGGHGEFKPTLVAVILEEAPRGGCGLALALTDELKTGVTCRAQVGKMAPLRAEVVWVRVLDDRVMRVGLKYLE